MSKGPGKYERRLIHLAFMMEKQNARLTTSQIAAYLYSEHCNENDVAIAPTHSTAARAAHTRRVIGKYRQIGILHRAGTKDGEALWAFGVFDPISEAAAKLAKLGEVEPVP